jgi:hypothetical protein
VRNHTGSFTYAPAQANAVEQDHKNHEGSQNPHGSYCRSLAALAASGALRQLSELLRGRCCAIFDA